MSFVSIIAREDFISVMSDGRVMDPHGIPIQEDYQKFIQINDQSFIAFAGTKEICEIIAQEMKDVINRNDDLQDHFQQLLARFQQLNLNHHGMKVFLGVGGINSDQEIEFHTINSKNGQVLNFSPKGGDVSYAFLNNSSYDEADLQKKLIEILRVTGFNTIDKIKNAQKTLNDFIAETDDTVNNVIYDMSVQRP